MTKKEFLSYKDKLKEFGENGPYPFGYLIMNSIHNNKLPLLTLNSQIENIWYHKIIDLPLYNIKFDGEYLITITGMCRTGKKHDFETVKIHRKYILKLVIL